MTFRETNCDPTPRDRKVMALTLCALGLLLALVIWFRPASLLVIGCVTALAWCVSMLFNAEAPRRHQWMSAMVPIAFGLVYAAAWAVGPAAAAIAVISVLALLGVVVWWQEKFGRSFHRAWMELFTPLAWSVSTSLLVLIYYGVITPFGLVMRLAGRDPMNRRFDRGCQSYWVKRKESADPARYFRQF